MSIFSGFKESISTDSNLQDKDRILREKEEEVKWFCFKLSFKLIIYKF